MEKKIYTYHHNISITLDLSVTASSEEEAKRLVNERISNIPYSSYDYAEENELTLLEVKELPDIDELTEQVIDLMKENDMKTANAGGTKVAKTAYETSGGMMLDEYEVEYEVEEVYLADDMLYVRYAEPYSDGIDAPDEEPLDELSEEEQYKILTYILE